MALSVSVVKGTVYNNNLNWENDNLPNLDKNSVWRIYLLAYSLSC